MIEKIEINGNNFKVEDGLRKYTTKRLGKLDRYLPHGFKKDVVITVVVAEIGKNHSDEYTGRARYAYSRKGILRRTGYH